jgi:hypothetical protein
MHSEANTRYLECPDAAAMSLVILNLLLILLMHGFLLV